MADVDAGITLWSTCSAKERNKAAPGTFAASRPSHMPSASPGPKRLVRRLVSTKQILSNWRCPIPITHMGQATISQAQIEVLRFGFDYYADYLHGSPSPGYFWFRKRQKVLALIARHFQASLDHTSSWKFADLGCGDGVDLFLIRRKILELITSQSAAAPATDSLRFVGVDGNPNLLRVCELKKRYYQADDTELVNCNLAARLPFDDDHFDFLYCSEVVEHLLEPDKFFAEVNRILKPGGHFLMTTPNEPNILLRSYWSRKRREAIKAQALRDRIEVIDPAGERLLIYGHVSLRKVTEWDSALSKRGFKRIDAARGALFYSAAGVTNNEWVLALQMCLEGTLDRLPVLWTRSLSDQLIGLYRKVC